MKRCREQPCTVQRMAGAIWTDYNYSDPGVTITKQLAYVFDRIALTGPSLRRGLFLAEPWPVAAAAIATD